MKGKYQGQAAAERFSRYDYSPGSNDFKKMDDYNDGSDAVTNYGTLEEGYDRMDIAHNHDDEQRKGPRGGRTF